MTANKTDRSWTISWDRFKYLVRQDFTIEYMADNEHACIIYELRFNTMLPGEVMELWVYERGCDLACSRMAINGAHNKVLRMRGNMVTVVPEHCLGAHPGVELRFYELAPVSASVLKGRNKKKKAKQ